MRVLKMYYAPQLELHEDPIPQWQSLFEASYSGGVITYAEMRRRIESLLHLRRGQLRVVDLEAFHASERNPVRWPVADEGKAADWAADPDLLYVVRVRLHREKRTSFHHEPLLFVPSPS